uniref:glutathione transferase n=1 Tax=Scleropages formosus TaxID=113540 RepID=A0A8C9S5R2_SCLFO
MGDTSAKLVCDEEKLGIDFTRMPYLVDGNRKIVQSNVIMRYIGHKHNLCRESKDEIVQVDIMEN